MGEFFQDPAALLAREARDLSDEDFSLFNSLTNVDLTAEETEAARSPTAVDPSPQEVFATHFHPEWVPLPLIGERLQKAFPNATGRLAIPTQHNVLLSLDDYTGVEADVFAPEYGIKIQLLVHFHNSRLPRAGTLDAMIQRTFRYRALQLLDVLAQLSSPDEATLKEIKKMGFHETSVRLARLYASKLQNLLAETRIVATPRAETLKNRLITDFIEKKATDLPPLALDRLLALVNCVKKAVKGRLNPARFHAAREVIEEARGLGAGIVIPHPPLFWPALLDDLDVDGWEVWNPSTPNHTLFLIGCLARKPQGAKRLLAFMGDDTHMSSKIRASMAYDKGGPPREIGFQPPWRDPAVAQALKDAGQSRERTLAEYRARLA
ncbi:MAG: hypothetical protein LBO66_04545 [Deltaproteobacteria bacterium]|nr:hypothetical protein [Deltaproteobacteria bacterium]